MDPFSGVTGLIGVLSVFVDVIGGLKSLRKRYRNAPALLKDIYNECTVSQTVLGRLKEILDRHSAAVKSPSAARVDLVATFDTSVSEIRHILEDFRRQLQKLRAKDDSKIALGFRTRAEVVWKESYLAETLRKIRDQRATIDFTISSLQFDTVHALHEQFSHTTDLLKNLPLRSESRERPGVNQGRAPARKKLMTKDLQAAMQGGDIDTVEQLLEQGADPNLPLDYKGWYALHYAAQVDDVELLQLLHEYGARLNVRGAALETPLLVAIRHRSTAVALCLVEMGAEVSLSDDKRETPLHKAAYLNNFPVLQHLLVKGADPKAEDQDGDTPLMNALMSPFREDGESNLLKTLLTYGADPFAGSASSPIHLAVLRKKHDDLVILAQAAKTLDVDLKLPIKRYAKSLNARLHHHAELAPDACFQGSLLFAAIWTGDVVAARILIRHGADVEHGLEISSLGGGTCLFTAIAVDRFDIARLLLESGAKPNYCDENGLTALLLAAGMPDRLQYVDLLLSHGALVEGRLPTPAWTPLQAAAAWGHFSVVEKLLENGANLETEEDDGYTALLFASESGNLAMMRLLVNKGANWRHACTTGETALHLACKGGHLLCASYLLGLGDDINKQSLDGLAPIHSAVLESNEEAVKWLLTLGVDLTPTINSSLVSGLTKIGGVGRPLDIAQALGYDGIEKLLQEPRYVESRTFWKSTPKDYTASLKRVSGWDFLESALERARPSPPASESGSENDQTAAIPSPTDKPIFPRDLQKRRSTTARFRADVLRDGVSSLGLTKVAEQ